MKSTIANGMNYKSREEMAEENVEQRREIAAMRHKIMQMESSLRDADDREIRTIRTWDAMLDKAGV